MAYSDQKPTAREFVEAYRCALTIGSCQEILVVLQAYFDDSGSDPSSRYYVLAGYVAALDTWTSFTGIWDYHLNKEPRLDYFKMSEAMGFQEQFLGWKKDDRDERVKEFAQILGNTDLHRIEVYLERKHFDDFVKGTIYLKAFDDPYFICFQHLCLTLAATAELNWSPDYKIIFDEHGKIGANAIFWWDQALKFVPQAWAARLGRRPDFESDVKFKPLQAADMAAWLVRDHLIRGDGIPKDEVAYIARRHMLKRSVIYKHMTADDLMQLGASMLVASSNMIRDFGTNQFVYEQSSKKFVRKKNHPPR
jgi:hypothetical protein